MAAKTAPIVVKVPVEEKKHFVELTKELGTTPSDAIRLFIRAFENEKGFPFTPKLKKVPTVEEFRSDPEYRPIPHLDKIPRIKLEVGKDGIAKLPKGVFEPRELEAWSV